MRIDKGFNDYHLLHAVNNSHTEADIDEIELKAKGLKFQKSQLDNNKMGQKEFLTVMMAQLKNQDPLDPKDSSEFASQMTQFGSLESLHRIETVMGDLKDAMLSSKGIQVSDWVGREIEVDGDNLAVEDGIPSKVFIENQAIEGADGKDIVDVIVQDLSNQTIYKDKIDFQGKGRKTYEWDGLDSAGKKVPDGNYKISIIKRKIAKHPMHASFNGSLKKNGQIKAEVDVPEDVKNLRLTISNANQEVVKVFDCGPVKKGKFEKNWNGLNHLKQPMPEGRYLVRAEDTKAMGGGLKLTTTAKVQSISLSGQGGKQLLNLSDGSTKPMSDVKTVGAGLDRLAGMAKSIDKLVARDEATAHNMQDVKLSLAKLNQDFNQFKNQVTQGETHGI